MTLDRTHTPPPKSRESLVRQTSTVKVRPDPLQGRIVLDRYRIISRIARGGMSGVYLGKDVEDGTQYAVKILRGELAMEQGVRERFIYETKATQLIDHPAIVKVLDIGELDDGRICLVMEYVLGQSLRRIINKGPIQVKNVISLSIALAEGLSAAHKCGVIHRDLKPENILIPRRVKDGVILRIVDFGIARIADAPRLTTTHHVMGTPQYIAPEQAMGDPIDHRVDIYALGVLMYEMLTGNLPFSDSDLDALLRKHISALPPPLDREEVAPIPEKLCEIVMRCLAKESIMRPPSMDAVIEELCSHAF